MALGLFRALREANATRRIWGSLSSHTRSFDACRGSQTAPARSWTHRDAQIRIAFRYSNNVGRPDITDFAAQWLAHIFPCQRFKNALTDASA